MATVLYQRPTGKSLTYTIRASRCGGYVIAISDRILKTSIPAGTLLRTPGSGNGMLEEHAIQEAKQAIDNLVGMDEE